MDLFFLHLSPQIDSIEIKGLSFSIVISGNVLVETLDFLLRQIKERYVVRFIYFPLLVRDNRRTHSKEKNSRVDQYRKTSDLMGEKESDHSVTFLQTRRLIEIMGLLRDVGNSFC